MNHAEALTAITELSQDDSTSFTEAGSELENNLRGLDNDLIFQHLMRAGAIPEYVGRNSTEEKLYAKYCDVVFADGMSHLGFEAEALDARGDAGDVDAIANDYKVVGDAKAFRLSRTATNQKDFKVEALNEWKGDAEYSCLLCPLYRYPNTRSQIYSQSIRYNVTLFSYTHLAFLVRFSDELDPETIEPLWSLSESLDSGKKAPEYWTSIQETVLDLTGEDELTWERTYNKRMDILASQARNQIEYWEGEKEKVKRLSRKEMELILIEEKNINSKIEKIRGTAELD